MMQQPFASPEEALEHFGIRGMRWGIRNEKGAAFVKAQNFGEPYSHAVGLGHGSKIFDLKKPEKLRVEERDGIIDVRPKNGFRTKRAEDFHNEMLSGAQEMRKEYPALRNIKIEITPMTHQPGGMMMAWGGTPAAAAHLKPGEVRLFYNDRMHGTPGKYPKESLKIQPGIQHKGFLGRHEMGHVLAMAGGQLPSSWKTTHEGSWKDLDAERELGNRLHKKLFAKHGLSFKELAELSPYAATEPGEGLAELVGYYHTPALRKQMSPSLQAKAKALLDDIGGKNR